MLFLGFMILFRIVFANFGVIFLVIFGGSKRAVRGNI